jgi:hypothetical protein
MSDFVGLLVVIQVHTQNFSLGEADVRLCIMYV